MLDADFNNFSRKLYKINIKNWEYNEYHTMYDFNDLYFIEINKHSVVGNGFKKSSYLIVLVIQTN